MLSRADDLCMGNFERTVVGEAVLIVGLGTVAGALLGLALGLAGLVWAARAVR